MPENIPPAPPASQPQGYPPHTPSGAIPGNEPPYNPPQQYAPMGQYGPPKAKSSGFRIAAGIVSIVLGTFLLVPGIAGFADFANDDGVLLTSLILAAGLGNITAGITLLVTQRSRTKWAPLTAIGLAAISILLGIIGMTIEFYTVGLFSIVLILAFPVLVVMGIGLAKEKRRA